MVRFYFALQLACGFSPTARLISSSPAPLPRATAPSFLIASPSRYMLAAPCRSPSLWPPPSLSPSTSTFIAGSDCSHRRGPQTADGRADRCYRHKEPPVNPPVITGEERSSPCSPTAMRRISRRSRIRLGRHHIAQAPISPPHRLCTLHHRYHNPTSLAPKRAYHQARRSQRTLPQLPAPPSRPSPRFSSDPLNHLLVTPPPRKTALSTSARSSRPASAIRRPAIITEARRATTRRLPPERRERHVRRKP